MRNDHPLHVPDWLANRLRHSSLFDSNRSSFSRLRPLKLSIFDPRTSTDPPSTQRRKRLQRRHRLPIFVLRTQSFNPSNPRSNLQEMGPCHNPLAMSSRHPPWLNNRLRLQPPPPLLRLKRIRSPCILPSLLPPSRNLQRRHRLNTRRRRFSLHLLCRRNFLLRRLVLT